MQDEMQDGFSGAQYFQGFETCDTGESNPGDNSRRIQCFQGFSGVFSAFILHFFEAENPLFCYIWSFVTNKMQDEMQDENRLKV